MRCSRWRSPRSPGAGWRSRSCATGCAPSWRVEAGPSSGRRRRSGGHPPQDCPWSPRWPWSRSPRPPPTASPGRRPGPLGYLVRHGRRGPRITGAKVIAIGDSVMLASAPELAQALPGIYINAQVSRAMIAGVAIVQQLARQGRLRPVLVVGLGTNGPITMGQTDQILAAIGPRRWLILVNTFVPRPWEQEVNSTIARAARRYFNVLMVNWHAAIEHHTSLLWSDGIHPQPPGGRLYARVVRAVVAMALRGRPRLPRRQPSIGHLLRGGEVRI